MDSLLAYPRLSIADTLSCLNTIKEVAARCPEDLPSLSALSHPRAEAVPTGATVATHDQLRNVRETVMDALSPWMNNRPTPRDSTVAFDLALGRSLHSSLRILPADAAHDETWSFLSAVVFPDVVWARFPDLHPDRVIGKRHRNTLRRAWFRYDVIGDLQSQAADPLGEDEMTGIFERAQLARNRQLVRTVAEIILNADVPNRSEYVRNLMKGITALTGPYLLDGLTTDELLERVAGLTETPVTHGRPPTTGGDASAQVASQAVRAETAGQPVERVTRHDRADLVRRFHAETIRLCKDVELALGRPPNVMLGMISQMGGVDATRAVVGSSSPSETFSLLWGCGRLDLTLEALILREEFQGLFSEALLRRAEDRLSQAGY